MMGMYNLLLIDAFACPYCHQSADPRVEIRCGALTLAEYQLGDTIQWATSKQKRKGYPPSIQQTRPPAGNHMEYGYTDCPHCQQDIWVRIEIRQDVFTQYIICQKNRFFES